VDGRASSGGQGLRGRYLSGNLNLLVVVLIRDATCSLRAKGPAAFSQPAIENFEGNMRSFQALMWSKKELLMSALADYQNDDVPNPLDVIETLATTNDWLFDRSADDEIHITVEGSWSDLHICLNWRSDLEGLHLAATFDMRVPSGRREEIGRLVSLINEQLFLGHFDLWRHDGALLFRNGLLLTGGAEASTEQCEALMALALEACERYYPAFQFVIWAGKNAEEAIEACLLETMGEA
jgi:hypothetical protein